MTITPFKILLCLILALLSSFVFKLLLKDKHQLYFKVKEHKSLITIKGAINQKMAIGMPINAKGYLLYFLLLTIIACEIIFVLYLF